LFWVVVLDEQEVEKSIGIKHLSLFGFRTHKNLKIF